MATFPTPGHSQTYDTGPIFLKYLKRPKSWQEVTVFSEFEDGGKDILVHAASPPQYWELEYDGLEDEDANILDEFWDAHGLHTPFTFIEPRTHPSTGVEGATYTNCYFAEPMERDHSKVWIQRRKVIIVKRPS